MEEASSLALRVFKWFSATETRTFVSLVLVWAVSIAAVLAQALFQRSALTIIDLAALFIICVLAGAISLDVGSALIGYIFAMGLGILIFFVSALIPTTTSNLTTSGAVVILQLWISIIFKTVFPFPFIAFLVASMIGGGLGEKYL